MHNYHYDDHCHCHRNSPFSFIDPLLLTQRDNKTEKKDVAIGRVTYDHLLYTTAQETVPRYYISLLLTCHPYIPFRNDFYTCIVIDNRQVISLHGYAIYNKVYTYSYL